MSLSYILLIYVAGVAVKESCADSVPTPTIVFSPDYINVATPVTVRCESPEGTECNFYRDHDPNPIRTVDYKQGACQFKLLWNEFKKWNKTEVDLSCVILQNREDKTIKTSKPSDARRLNVGDPIGMPSVHVEKIGNYLNLRCECKAGTSCYFYLNNGDSHFKKLPYKDNVCVGRVAEEELQRKRSSAGEIFITCAVELLVEGEDTVTSQRSESSEEDSSLQYATVTSTSDQASLQYATVTSTGNQVGPGRTKIKFEKAGEYALLAES
ncbi:uncharacterized protein [Salmo salar]|uniref:Uncharacterized protein n=1 Tax=Salmo salar TaxID=8030 RepID=A0ABM3EFI4_SALSA|nr:uncharacterized protein LOC106567180 [Salmo salar]